MTATYGRCDCHVADSVGASRCSGKVPNHSAESECSCRLCHAVMFNLDDWDRFWPQWIHHCPVHAEAWAMRESLEEMLEAFPHDPEDGPKGRATQKARSILARIGRSR